MRKIEVKSWKVKDQAGKEMDESLLSILSVLVTSKKPEEMPHGFAGFKLFRKLAKSFEKADETKVLLLEEDVYLFLKKIVETDIPSNWAGNEKIFDAVTAFMETKEE